MSGSDSNSKSAYGEAMCLRLLGRTFQRAARRDLDLDAMRLGRRLEKEADARLAGASRTPADPEEPPTA